MSDELSSERAVPAVFSSMQHQSRAVAVLSGSLVAPYHAYLFLGPHGSGKRDAARLMAAALLCPNGGCGDCPSCRDVLAGLHPDLSVVERVGASITVGQAEQVIALAQRSPSVGERQVIVLLDFHLVDEAAPALLKTIEEPPSTTVFLIVADALPRQLVTIASRCVLVEFNALDNATIEAILQEEGIDESLAASAAAASRGAIDRARLFALDPGFGERQTKWRTVPERLDGTGATVSILASELLSGVDGLVDVVKVRQAKEQAELTEALVQAGESRSGAVRNLTERHRREQRRIRTDELRAGLASLAEAYRGRLSNQTLPPRRLAHLAQACATIDLVAADLVRNPNERLMLENLLLRLDRAS